MSTTSQAELTPGSVCQSLAGTPISDELLEWPPDVFALSRGSTGMNASLRWPAAQAVERDPGYVLDLLRIAGWELADPDDRVEDVVAGGDGRLPPLTVERGTPSSG
jgi:hypothetical protein